jgi:hypothetical protein
MENNQNADTDCMVYPGVYVPSRDDQEVEAELKNSCRVPKPVNLTYIL